MRNTPVLNNSIPKGMLIPTAVLLMICLVPESFWQNTETLEFYQYLTTHYKVVRSYAAASDFPITTSFFIAALPFCFFSSLTGFIYSYYKLDLLDGYFFRREEKIKTEGVFSVIKFDVFAAALFSFILIASFSLHKDPLLVGLHGVNHSKFGMLIILGIGWVYGLPVLISPLFLDLIFFSKKFIK